MVPARPFLSGSPGWVRSKAWTWLFSSQHRTIACSGAFRYKPMISSSFSAKHGSFETLKVRLRCGLSPCSRQTRPTVLALTSMALAIDVRLQCVAATGISVVVFLTRRRRISGGYTGLRPRPGRSDSMPARPHATKRVRQRPTFCRVTFSFLAICSFVFPFAARSTTKQRSCRRFGVSAPWIIFVTQVRSSAVKLTVGALRIP